MSRQVLWGLLLMLLGSAVSRAESILYTNVEPGGVFGSDAVDFGPGPAPGDRDPAAALRFSVASDSTLTGFHVPLYVLSGVNDVSAFLLSDASGLPGSIIETYELSTLPSNRPAPLSAVPSATRPTLSADKYYWFAVRFDVTPQQPASGGWMLTSFHGDSSVSPNFAVAGVVGDPNTWLVGSGGPSGREGALTVVGEPIPEPTTAVTAVLSILVLFRSFRRSLLSRQ